MNAIKVLLADDHPIVREGLRSYLSTQRTLQVANAADLGVCRFKRVEDDVLADFTRTRFDHHDSLFRPGDDEVQARFASFVVSRIDDVTAFDQTDAHPRNRIRERNVGEIERA